MFQQTDNVFRQMLDLIEVGNKLTAHIPSQSRHLHDQDLTVTDIQHFTSSQFLTPQRNIEQLLWKYNSLDSELIITFIDIACNQGTATDAVNVVGLDTIDSAMTATVGIRINRSGFDSQPPFGAIQGAPLIIYVPKSALVDIVCNVSGSGNPTQGNAQNIVTTVRGFKVKHGKGKRFKEISSFIANVKKQVDQDGTTSTTTATP